MEGLWGPEGNTTSPPGLAPCPLFLFVLCLIVGREFFGFGVWQVCGKDGESCLTMLTDA
jgi:hypothetical protein